MLFITPQIKNSILPMDPATSRHWPIEHVEGSNAMKVFLTGATGYIGGTVAIKLVAAGHKVVGLVWEGEKESGGCPELC
jgi:hypothetical protein